MEVYTIVNWGGASSFNLGFLCLFCSLILGIWVICLLWSSFFWWFHCLLIFFQGLLPYLLSFRVLSRWLILFPLTLACSKLLLYYKFLIGNLILILILLVLVELLLLILTILLYMDALWFLIHVLVTRSFLQLLNFEILVFVLINPIYHVNISSCFLLLPNELLRCLKFILAKRCDNREAKVVILRRSIIQAVWTCLFHFHISLYRLGIYW